MHLDHYIQQKSHKTKLEIKDTPSKLNDAILCNHQEFKNYSTQLSKDDTLMPSIKLCS